MAAEVDDEESWLYGDGKIGEDDDAKWAVY